MRPRLPAVRPLRLLPAVCWDTVPVCRRPAVYRLSSSSSSSPSSPSSSPSSPSVARLLAWTPTTPVPDIAVHGYVRSVRAMKKHAFVTLGDGSSLAPLQAVVPAAMAGGLTNGAAVRLHGDWVPSPGAGQSHELRVRAVAVLGPSDAATFPLQKKHQTPAFLRTVPHLRARLPFQTTLLRLRSAAMAALARFFAERDFVQTHPPLLTSSDCEGAGEVFAVTTGETAVTTGETAVTTTTTPPATPPFFPEPKYLTVSAQLHLEALAQAVGRVWTLAPTFRAEASDTPRHLCEFYMLEAEVGFIDDLDDLMDLVEGAVRAVATDLYGTKLYEELLERRPEAAAAAATTGTSSSTTSYSTDREDPPTIAARWQALLGGPRWRRITYTDAIARLAAAPVPFAQPPVWGSALQTEHERYLAETVGGGGPVFVTHYPAAAKAFYMLGSDGDGDGDGGGDGSSDGHSPDRATAACFDLLVPGLCEVAGGSLREHRLPQLLAAMHARGLATDPLAWYVDLRRWGCPPHGGFGLGFDRLLCYLAGVRAIRDTVAFPRWHGRCDC